VFYGLLHVRYHDKVRRANDLFYMIVYIIGQIQPDFFVTIIAAWWEEIKKHVW
jgi:hypothetical protein